MNDTYMKHTDGFIIEFCQCNYFIMQALKSGIEFNHGLAYCVKTMVRMTA